MTVEEKSRMIQTMLESPVGEAKLAESLALPIGRRLDRAGVARKAFVVDPLPEGALPIYESEEDALVARITNKPW